MTKEQVRLLQAEIQADLHNIAEVYAILNALNRDISQKETAIVVAYYLNVLYGLFENLFKRIATLFGNQVEKKSQWRAQLLHRMTLDVKDVRPRVISDEPYICLNELRRFRHIFRNTYLLHFDPTRLGLVIQKAEELKALYPPDLNRFLAFLEELALKGKD